MEKRYDKVINTKINIRTYAQLRAIADRANLTIYNILQSVIDCFVKCFCEREPINDYMREILCKFIDIDRAKNGFSLLAPTLRDLSMSKCLAIVSKAKKTIPEIVLIEKDGDSITENLNSDAILTEFLQAFSPKILRGLQKIKESENMHNLTDALLYATNETAYPKDPLHNEIEQLFSEANNCAICAQLQPTGAHRGARQKQIENLCAGDFEPKNYKRPYTRQYKESEPAQRNFDPSQIEEPLQIYEPEFVPDKEPEFAPDFDPSEIYDPLQDYEPEFVPDYEPQYI